MPSKSKAQQRFMGLVHAFNKGDVPASKVSKKVKDVAKDMKKKDVKDFASTKHKGKPEKVKQEAINKIKEMIRLELESCGYTMSAENPNYKLKSPGGTGDEDKKLKENMKDVMKNAIHQVKTFDKPSNKKLMTIKVINKLKEKRNNSKSSSNKKQLQKMIDKVESDYKKGKYLKESVDEATSLGADMLLGGIATVIKKAGMRPMTAKMMGGGFKVSKRDKVGFKIDVEIRGMDKKKTFPLQFETERGMLYVVIKNKPIKLGKYTMANQAAQNLKKVGMALIGDKDVKRIA